MQDPTSSDPGLRTDRGDAPVAAASKRYRPANPTASMFEIGAHTSIAGGVHHAVDEQFEHGGTCGQIFSH